MAVWNISEKGVKYFIISTFSPPIPVGYKASIPRHNSKMLLNSEDIIDIIYILDIQLNIELELSK
jgi:hypothetical protein